MNQSFFVAGVVVLSMGAAGVFACSSDATENVADAGTDAAETSTSTDDTGTAPTEAGPTDAASDTATTLAPGGAMITATFTNPVDSYDGVLDPYTSSAVTSKMEVSKKGISFTTGDNNQPFSRTVAVAVGNLTPVQGTTYPIGSTGGDLIAGNQMTYQTLHTGTTVSKSWICDGSVTFDSVVGKAYSMRFTGVCKVYGGSAKGGVTITGQGTGVLP